MSKAALLIGVSEYKSESGLKPLPSAAEDVLAMQRILLRSCEFTAEQIRVLPNPQKHEVEEAIYWLFANRQKEDLLLFYFSGHGIKDQIGKLYFSLPSTCKDQRGELMDYTAVPATILHEKMNGSRSTCQVLVLDCCFSGAFAKGLTVKDDNSVDIPTQLGGKGRAIFASSNSIEYSFQQQGLTLSVYTHFFIEGLEKGSADLDGDGLISADELHVYVSEKVKQAAPAMTPQFFPMEQGHKIYLGRSAKDDPRLKYRKAVEQRVNQSFFQINYTPFSIPARKALNLLSHQLSLSTEVAEAIEAEVTESLREYQRKLHDYEQALRETIEKEGHPLSGTTQKDLNDYQTLLGLRNEDVQRTEANILFQRDNQEIIEVIYQVQCQIQGYSASVFVENIVQLLPKELTMFKKMVSTTHNSDEEPPLKIWVKNKLDQIIKSVFLSKQYVDVLINFESIVLNIKTRINDEIESIGFSAVNIICIPQLKHLELKRDFVLEEPEGIVGENERIYLTKDAVQVRLNCTITARIENFHNIEEYLILEVEIKDLIKSSVRSTINNYLKQITSERYYMRFYYLSDDDKDNSLEEKPVEQELQEAIAKTLQDQFGARAVNITLRPEDASIVRQYRELRGRIGLLKFVVTSLPNVESIQFYAEFQVLGVAKNCWYIFQEQMAFMWRSQEARRLELARLKELHERMVSRNFLDDEEEVSQIQERIFLVEEELSGINIIKKTIENHLYQKLSLFKEYTLAYTVPQNQEAIQKALNNWAGEVIKNQYGLEIIVYNLRRDPTLEEQQKAFEERQKIDYARRLREMQYELNVNELQQLYEKRAKLIRQFDPKSDQDELDHLTKEIERLEGKISSD